MAGRQQYHDGRRIWGRRLVCLLMAPPALVLWKLLDADLLRWRWWGDQLVVFHAGSGDTHLLDALAGQVLDCLRRSPATLDELAEQLPPGSGLGSPDELRQALARVLDELSKHGLIEGSVP